MSDKLDRLQLLKSRYFSQLREKEQEILALKTKISLLDELDAEAATLVASGGQSPGLYATMGLTDAVLDAVKSIATTAGATAPRIAKHLIDGGFVPKGKNFKITVGTTLGRLVDQEKIRTDKVGGERLYMTK